MQELNAAGNALQFFAGAAHFHAVPRTRRENDCIVFRTERVQRDIPAKPDIVFHGDAELLNLRNFPVEQVFRQTVGGNAVAEHTAHFRSGIVNRDIMPFYI